MKWDPLHDLVALRDRGPYRPGAADALWTPNVDLLETDSAFLIVAELPGVGPDDFSITAHADGLVLTGERPAPSPTATPPRFLRMERGYGRFTRAFSFPEPVNVAAIGADFDRGLLTITVPKAVPGPDRRIKIG